MKKQPQRRGGATTTEREAVGVRLMRLGRELASQVPEEERRNIPPDFLDNLDHYLYGAPKKPPRR